MSADEARGMAEFQDGGRTAYFVANPVTFWLLAKRSGAVPEPVLRDILLIIAALLALLRWRQLPEPLRRLCLASALAGVILWAAAHVVLFKLYLPGRYSLIGLRVALGLLAGAGLAAWMPKLGRGGRSVVFAALIGLPLLALLVPPRALGLIGVAEAPAVVEAVRAAPKNTLVAGFAPDLDNIPALAQRRVLTAREYHLPYGREYVREMRERLGDTASAVFAGGPEGVRRLVSRYGITHLLIDRREVTPTGARQSWWWPILAQEKRLPDCGEEACRVWALTQRRCVVAEEAGEVLLSAACLLRPPGAGVPRQDAGGPRPAAG
ncbi:hypothetical protein [Pedomonas mirosovicensis]|uniref:hypothetical protein n=1 Tax=Pedomonas mirosovicensis TaxID=2908641 RepID=UPI0021686EAF|nr:hypothetical protein [Pedomonas mirosovicensis]MCH8685625.1 hypothetical protein [Pedomonas mirosovicensis]